jgi:hypothetical protein
MDRRKKRDKPTLFLLGEGVVAVIYHDVARVLALGGRLAGFTLAAKRRHG